MASLPTFSKESPSAPLDEMRHADRFVADLNPTACTVLRSCARWVAYFRLPLYRYIILALYNNNMVTLRTYVHADKSYFVVSVYMH